MLGEALVMPLCRTVLFRRSFRCASVEFWNSIPVDIRNESFNGFKKRLFEFLYAKETSSS